VAARSLDSEHSHTTKKVRDAGGNKWGGGVCQGAGHMVSRLKVWVVDGGKKTESSGSGVPTGKFKTDVYDPARAEIKKNMVPGMFIFRGRMGGEGMVQKKCQNISPPNPEK